jgi:hypothetical protein
LHAVHRAPEGASTKLALVLWFLGVALAPRGLAQYLVALRFVPSSRPHTLRRWLTRLSILRPLRSVMETRLAPSQPSARTDILPPQSAIVVTPPTQPMELIQAPLSALEAAAAPLAAAAMPGFPEGGRSDATT